MGLRALVCGSPGDHWPSLKPCANDSPPQYKVPAMVDHRNATSPNVLPSDRNSIILGRFVGYDVSLQAYREHNRVPSTIAASAGFDAYDATNP